MKRRPLILKNLHSDFEWIYFVNKHELNKYKLFDKKKIDEEDLSRRSFDGVLVKTLDYCYKNEHFLFDFNGYNCYIVDKNNHKAFDKKGMFYCKEHYEEHGLRKNKIECSFHWKNEILK